MDLASLSAMPSIKLVMTPFPYFVDEEDTLARAESMMKAHDVHHIPVQHHGKLMGILDSAEIARSAADQPDGSLDEAYVRDTPCAEAYVVDYTAPLDHVLSEMAERRIGSALVTRKGKLVGIFSTTDACRVLAKFLQAEFEKPGGEAA